MRLRTERRESTTPDLGLQVYGDLSGMTRTLTNMGQMDGAKGKAHGTRLPPGPGMSADPGPGRGRG